MASTNNGGGDSLVNAAQTSEITTEGRLGLYVVAALGLAVAVAVYFAGLDRLRASVESRVERGDRSAIAQERSLRMWLAAISSFGIGYTWAIQQSRLTGLLKALGFSHRQLMAAFAPGTVIGIFVQPIIAVISDNFESPFGKRRPFVFVGGLVLVASYAVLSNSYSIGTALGDAEGGGAVVGGAPRLRVWGTAFAVLSFWVADFSINAAQLPLRVLASSMVGHEHQDEVMARFSVTDNAGKLFAYLLGTFSLATPEGTARGDTELIADVRAQFAVSCVCVLVSFATTCLFVREPDSRPVHKQPRRLDVGIDSRSGGQGGHGVGQQLRSQLLQRRRTLLSAPLGGGGGDNGGGGGGGSGGGGSESFEEQSVALMGGRRGGVRLRPVDQTDIESRGHTPPRIHGSSSSSSGVVGGRVVEAAGSVRSLELELERTQTRMAQKPLLCSQEAATTAVAAEAETGDGAGDDGPNDRLSKAKAGSAAASTTGHSEGEAEARTRDEFLALYGYQTGAKLWALATPVPPSSLPSTSRDVENDAVAAAVKLKGHGRMRRHKAGRWSLTASSKEADGGSTNTAAAAPTPRVEGSPLGFSGNGALFPPSPASASSSSSSSSSSPFSSSSPLSPPSSPAPSRQQQQQQTKEQSKWGEARGRRRRSTQQQQQQQQQKEEEEGRDGGCLSLVRGALGEMRDAYVCTVTAGNASFLAPLRDVARVEFFAWFFWAVLGLWGPLLFSIQIFQGDPVAVVCSYPHAMTNATTTTTAWLPARNGGGDEYGQLLGSSVLGRNQSTLVRNSTSSFSSSPSLTSFTTTARHTFTAASDQNHTGSRARNAAATWSHLRTPFPYPEPPPPPPPPPPPRPLQLEGSSVTKTADESGHDESASTPTQSYGHVRTHHHNDDHPPEQHLLKSSSSSIPHDKHSRADDTDDYWQAPPLPVPPAFMPMSSSSSSSSGGQTWQGSGGYWDPSRDNNAEKEAVLSGGAGDLVLPVPAEHGEGSTWLSAESSLASSASLASAPLFSVTKREKYVCVPDEPKRNAFEHGLHLFSLGCLGSVLLSIFVSPSIPRLLRYYGNRLVWGYSLVSMAAISLGLALLPVVPLPWAEPAVGQAGLLGSPRGLLCAGLMALAGVPWAIRMTVPYVVVGKNYPSDGVLLSVVNSHLCVTQLLVAITTPVAVSASGHTSGVFFSAAALVLVGAFFAFTMDEGSAAHHSVDPAWKPGQRSAAQCFLSPESVVGKEGGGGVGIGTRYSRCYSGEEEGGGLSDHEQGEPSKVETKERELDRCPPPPPPPHEGPARSATEPIPADHQSHGQNCRVEFHAEQEGGYLAPSANEVIMRGGAVQ